jgi:hypothetical protein
MAKQTTTAVHKSASKAKSAKVKKSKDSILRDHSLDLLVHGKRKRVPTLRAIEAQALLKPSKKIKKAAPKKGHAVKRTHTMKSVLKDAEVIIANLGATRGKKSADKSSASGKKPAVSRSRSRNNSKAAHKKGAKGASRSKSGKRSVSKSATKSPSKGKGKQQHHESEDEHSGSGSKSRSRSASEEHVHHDSKVVTPAKSTSKAQGSTAKKGGPKRTKTMQDTLNSGKAFLKASAQRGRSKSASKKNK